MPAARSSSIPPRSQPFCRQSPPRRSRQSSPHHQEVISSTDSEKTKVPRVALHQERSRPKKPLIIPSVDEVIEISSDDEPSHLLSQPSVIADLRRQINKLREESVKHKKDFERASGELNAAKEENHQLQALRAPANGKIILDMAQITDQLDCEICTSTMWTPYILPGCGHSFCQSCLLDWFRMTKTQFLATHPENDPQLLFNRENLIAVVQAISRNPEMIHHRHIVDLLAQYIPPQPAYTCPTCRESVQTRPTEAFALKALVRTITSATGKSSPKKTAQAKHKGKGAALASVDPWDGLFPLK